MFRALFFVVFLSLCCATFSAIPDEDWGYVNVRQSANLFWWLYGQADATKRDQAPLVIWLQGGPGASSTGFGNFAELGPLDVNLQPRKVNWVQSANVMFIDSPVGAGFSYTTSPDAYCRSDEQVGDDLVVLLKSFLLKYPSLQTVPLWVFCESYGGKESTSFAVAIVQALQQGAMRANFQGVALGDSWISPIDFVMTYAEYLYTTSEVDYYGLAKINQSAYSVLNAVNTRQWALATTLWGNNQDVIENVTSGINFYNILNRASSDFNHKYEKSLAARNLVVYQDDPLTVLMNGIIRQKLKIIPTNVTW